MNYLSLYPYLLSSSLGFYGVPNARDEWAYDAWERMTSGGVEVVNEKDIAGENIYPPYLLPYPEPADALC